MRLNGHIVLVTALLLSSATVPSVPAIETWTPETGEVDLEQRPRTEPEARFRHTVALIAAGESESAAHQLSSLLEEHPDADWAERAHYLLGLARYNSGQWKGAFNAWHPMHEKYPASDRLKKVFELQRDAAGQQTQRNLDSGMKLFERLTKIAPDAEAAAICQKSKADALLAAGHYLRASDQYLALIDYYPDSTWVPYAWYQIGRCHLKLSEWIGRGTEHLEEARSRFKDFLDNFPEHRFADEAKGDLKKVQLMLARKHEDVARYYMGPAQRPTAALAHLRRIHRAIPDSRRGEWAEKKINEIINQQKAPPEGRVRGMALPGATRIEEGEQKER